MEPAGRWMVAGPDTPSQIVGVDVPLTIRKWINWDVKIYPVSISLAIKWWFRFWIKTECTMNIYWIFSVGVCHVTYLQPQIHISEDWTECSLLPGHQCHIESSKWCLGYNIFISQHQVPNMFPAQAHIIPSNYVHDVLHNVLHQLWSLILMVSRTQDTQPGVMSS